MTFMQKKLIGLTLRGKGGVWIHTPSPSTCIRKLPHEPPEQLRITFKLLFHEAGGSKNISFFFLSFLT